MTFDSLLRRALFSRIARRLWTVALAFFTIVVLVMALSPTSGEGSPMFFGWDKADHMVAFSTLAVCGVYGLRGRPAASLNLALGLLLLGIGIELAQTQVPGRSAGFDDVVADVVGIALGMALAHGVAARLERRATPRRDEPGR